jgi:DNA-binding beta-propeller fold protein YncE
MAFFRDGKEIIVVDSDSSHVPGADNLAVVGVSQALAGEDRGGLLGVVPAGPVPWAVALEPGGATALVTDYGSGQVEAIDTRSLP